MRELTKAEVEEVVESLRGIASFYNPAVDQNEGAQAAAREARATLERLTLLGRGAS